MSEISEAEIESQLKGKTLLVYWFLLKSQESPVGVREIQRKLGFSSPSVASHHLDKLHSLGVVEKTIQGEYVLSREVKVGVLRSFTRLGRFMIPRYLFYSVWFSTMIVVYLVLCSALYGFSGSIHNLVAVIFGFSACAILWYETVRLWKEKPA